MSTLPRLEGLLAWVVSSFVLACANLVLIFFGLTLSYLLMLATGYRVRLLMRFRVFLCFPGTLCCIFRVLSAVDKQTPKSGTTSPRIRGRYWSMEWSSGLLETHKVEEHAIQRVSTAT